MLERSVSIVHKEPSAPMPPGTGARAPPHTVLSLTDVPSLNRPMSDSNTFLLVCETFAWKSDALIKNSTHNPWCGKNN